ncbi:MAG: BrnA antitoxin family protein [Gemmatimonadetes bacterium]|nr:BrnA antitoxin family protein [Gemmatimonadota bacterium]
MPKPSPRSRRPTTPTKGRADLARLRRMTDAEIERTSPPELRNLPDDFWTDARVVVPVTKEAISIRLDHDVIAWFRATGPRYQSRINAVLRSYVEHASTPPAPRKRQRAS